MGERFKMRGEIPRERVLEAQVDEVLTGRHRKMFQGVLAQQLSSLGVDPNIPAQVAVAAQFTRRVVSETGPDIVVVWFYKNKFILRVYWHRGGERIFVDQPRLKKP